MWNKRFSKNKGQIFKKYLTSGTTTENGHTQNFIIKIKKNFFTAHRTLSEITKYEKGNEHLKMMLSVYEDNKKEKKRIQKRIWHIVLRSLPFRF